eukprot:260987_1
MKMIAKLKIIMVVIFLMIISYIPTYIYYTLSLTTVNLISDDKQKQRNNTDQPLIRRPNLLLLFPDQLRFDWTDNHYSTSLHLNTPIFKSITLNGTRFVNTVVASPTCVPSRACLAAGQGYDETKVFSNSYDWPLNKVTFYKYLQQNGYWTMITGKDDLTKLHGVGLNGYYRLNDIGFDDQARCKGKLDGDNSYPTKTDPFTSYLLSKTN